MDQTHLIAKPDTTASDALLSASDAVPKAALTNPKAESPSAAGESGKADVRKIAVGAAIGIGSAAIVAALLYANRDKKKS